MRLAAARRLPAGVPSPKFHEKLSASPSGSAAPAAVNVVVVFKIAVVGEIVKEPAVGRRELSRERFHVRQGLLVSAGLAVDAAPQRVNVLVLDEGGRVLLDQDIVVAASAP